MGDVLEDRVKKQHSKNKIELTLHLIEEWNKIEPSMLEKLVESVPIRLNECITMKGYATHY